MDDLAVSLQAKAYFVAAIWVVVPKRDPAGDESFSKKPGQPLRLVTPRVPI
jgi:hypothetical protein